MWRCDQSLAVTSSFSKLCFSIIYDRYQFAGDGMLLSKPVLGCTKPVLATECPHAYSRARPQPWTCVSSLCGTVLGCIVCKAALSAWLLLPPSFERGSVSCQTWRVSLQRFRVRIVFMVSLGAVIPARTSSTLKKPLAGEHTVSSSTTTIVGDVEAAALLLYGWERGHRLGAGKVCIRVTLSSRLRTVVFQEAVSCKPIEQTPWTTTNPTIYHVALPQAC